MHKLRVTTKAVVARAKHVKMSHLLFRNTGTQHKMQCSRIASMYYADVVTRMWRFSV